jgi:hypothetical protein
MARVRKTFVAKQPGKALWTGAALLWTLVRLPVWLACYIPKRFRPHPKWTYKQALMNRLLEANLYHSSIVEICTPVRLDETDGFVRIHPSADDGDYHGLLDDAEIRPAVTGGTWYPSPATPADEQTVILHLHGGAYVTLEGRGLAVAFAGKTLATLLGRKVLLPSYRLASNEGCHFPAALQDAVTAYRHLLDRGIPARRIVLCGGVRGAAG